MMQAEIINRRRDATVAARTHSSMVAIPATAAKVAPAAVGLAVVETAIGYEWLLSGLNKVLSSDFSSGLAKQLQSSLQGNPNGWYASLTNALVVPHAHLFATLVEAGELLVGLGLFAGAALWATGRITASRARLLNLGVIAALVGGILMSANYAVLSGDTLPGLNPGNAFNEGISIDSLLTIIGIGLLVVHVVASRRSGKNRAAR
jgi:thiosulfate dehydrogenase [quinone] large subunit